MAQVINSSGNCVGEVSPSGTVTDTAGNYVGEVIGVGSVSTGGILHDARGRSVGTVQGRDSVSVAADVRDSSGKYVGKIVGLGSASHDCYVQNSSGIHVGKVMTTHDSAVGAALLLLPVGGKPRNVHTVTGGNALVTGEERAVRQQPVRKVVNQTAIRPPRRRRRAVLISAASLAVIAAATVSVVLLTRPSPPAPGSVSYIATSPDGRLVDATPNGRVILWNIATRHVVAALTDPGTQGIAGVAFSGNAKEMAVADGNGAIYVWDVTTRHLVTTIDDRDSQSSSGIALSADGRKLAEYDSNNQVFIWDIASRKVAATVQILPPNSNDFTYIDSVALNPDGKYLAVSLSPSGNPGVEVWDVATRQLIANVTAEYGGGQVNFSANGRTLITSSSGTFTLWAVLNGVLTEDMTLNDPIQSPSSYPSLGDGSAVYSPAGSMLATADGSPTGSAFLWNLSTGHMAATLTDPRTKGVVGLAYSPDGKTLITADGNGSIYLWNIATRRISATLTSPSS